jgi:predicted RNA binding protein YcfA (HicA-like mRNA interferase family)
VTADRKGPPVPVVIHMIESFGYKRIRSKGNHAVFRHADGRVVVLPTHGTIRHGVLSAVLRQAGPRTEWSL